MGNPSQSSNAGPSTAWGQPYSPPAKQHSSILLHQCLSFPLNALLYTTATPFSPLAWILGPHEGAFLFDRFAGGIILLSALYFQFKLASRTHAVVVTVPNPLAQPETYVREGRLQRARWGPEFVFLYEPRRFFWYAGVEVGALLLGSVPGLEYVRRGVVLVVLAALWAGGWRVTPESTKRWAWGHVKWYWTWIAFSVLGDVYASGRAGARRRR